MTIDLNALRKANRLLVSGKLIPLQGSRFQSTGFPNLGAATYQVGDQTNLLVESAQSMANRMEAVCWDEATQDLVPELQGLSHIRVTRKGAFLTDSILESHRINSPYILRSKKDSSMLSSLLEATGLTEKGPVEKNKAVAALLRFDFGALLHGVFFASSAKDALAKGRLRIPRAVSAFIEAENARVAASGGAKHDRISSSGDSDAGFGHLPFPRDEFTAERITLYFNLDLAQIRGYRLGEDVEELLILLALYKLQALVSRGLRLRTACDLKLADAFDVAEPTDFVLPNLAALTQALPQAIAKVKDRMEVRTVTFEDELGKGKNKDKDSEEEEA